VEVGSGSAAAQVFERGPYLFADCVEVWRVEERNMWARLPAEEEGCGMRAIKSITTLKAAEDWGWLIAVCADGTVWKRAFPVQDDWSEIQGVPTDDEIFTDQYLEKMKGTGE
jgi:hypothetical protein